MGIKSLEFFKSNNFANDGEEIKTITLSVLNNEIEKLNKQEIINQTNP